jgi:transglutaminase-like putative cysteine protease
MKTPLFYSELGNLLRLTAGTAAQCARRLRVNAKREIRRRKKDRNPKPKTAGAVPGFRLRPSAVGLRVLILGFLCLGLAGCDKQAPPEAAGTPTDRLEQEGHFKEAAAALKQALQNKTLGPVERKNLEFDLDRLDRIKKDFSFTKESLGEELDQHVKYFTAEEYDRWIEEGRFDSREIDGKRYYVGTSVNNLFFRYPELASRRLPPKDSAAVDRAFWESCVAIKEATKTKKTPYVLPKRFDVTMTVTAKENAAPNGEIIRAWLPVPREYPFQNGFEMIGSTPQFKHLDDTQSPIRSVFLEQPAQKGKPTEFSVHYSYTMYGVCFDPQATEVRPCDPQDPALKEFIAEAPHVVFTPELRALSRQIVGGETNPCVVAKKCFDWIADNIKYSYAIEYSTIRNISDYCRTKSYGDCGQEAMLFITLCRLNGVPARWETGWHTFPKAKDIHDWSEIYLAPYGWMPVDPYMGVHAMRYATTLSPEQRRELRDFYFGGLDQYRMIANGNHCQTLNPPKQSLRSDNVDFQRGELEWGEHNIYFDQYSYNLSYQEVAQPNLQ